MSVVAEAVNVGVVLRDHPLVALHRALVVLGRERVDLDVVAEGALVRFGAPGGLALQQVWVGVHPQKG